MSIEVVIFILSIAVLFGTAISILVSTLRNGSPPMPSAPSLRRTMIAMTVDADPGEGVIYELGSGWGGLARALARNHAGHVVIGVEGSFIPWCFAAAVCRFFGPPNLRFVLKDLQEMDLSDASLAVCYLSGETLRRIAPRLENSLPTGCPVVSATFAWPGRVALDVQRAEDIYRSPIYLYRME